MSFIPFKKKIKKKKIGICWLDPESDPELDPDPDPLS